MDAGCGSIDPEIVAAWIGDIDVARKTADAYALSLKEFAVWADSCGRDFDALQADDVLDYKQWMLYEKKASPATVSLRLSALRSFYSWSERRGLDDIARSVKGASPSRARKRDALTLDQARRLLSSLPRDGEKGLRDAAVVELMLRTGLRDVEVVRADIGDLREKGGRLVLYVKGKGRLEKDAYVVVSPAVEEAVARYLDFRPGAAPDSPLFASVAPRNAGGRLTERSVSRIVRNALDAAGLSNPKLTAHSLRHTAVTFALLGGATEREAQAMARHADISTTMAYAHDLERLSSPAEDRIDEYLTAGKGFVAIAPQGTSGQDRLAARDL